MSLRSPTWGFSIIHWALMLNNTEKEFSSLNKLCKAFVEKVQNGRGTTNKYTSGGKFEAKKVDDNRHADGTLYRRFIGSLMHLTTTKTYINYAVSFFLVDSWNIHGQIIGKPEKEV